MAFLTFNLTLRQTFNVRRENYSPLQGYGSSLLILPPNNLSHAYKTPARILARILAGVFSYYK